MIEIFLLSLIQGLTEFIPVSSSSHLLVLSKYINFENQGLSIDVSLHIGSFLAVIVYFRKDLINFFDKRDIFYKIIFASLPVILVGFFFVQTNLIYKLRNIEVIGWTTIIFGILLFFSDRLKLNKSIERNLNYKDAFLIGLFQILSLIPGVSRSGITISAGRILNYSRYDSSKISFLLSIPTLGAVSIFGLKNIIFSDTIFFSFLNLTAIFLSFFFSFLTIKYFLKYVKKFSLSVFVIYRLLIGAILPFIVYL